MLIVSPYLARNYYQFNTFTITKSLGYNLLKGNNPDFKVEAIQNTLKTILIEKISVSRLIIVMKLIWIIFIN